MILTFGDPTFYIRTKYVQQPILPIGIVLLGHALRRDWSRIVFLRFNLFMHGGWMYHMSMDKEGYLLSQGEVKLYW